MSKFQGIQERFNALRDDEDAYWSRLEAVLPNIRLGLAEFLGVDANEKIGGENSLPAIHFGAPPPAFGGKSGHETIREGNELVFTLNIVLDSVNREFPPNFLRFRCRVKYVAENYMLIFDGSEGIYTTVKEDFSPFYERLHKSCYEMLDKFTRL